MAMLAPVFCVIFIFLGSRMSLIGRGIDGGKSRSSYSRE